MTPRLVDIPVLETDRTILRVPEARDYDAWEAFFCSDRAQYVGGGAKTEVGRAWRAFGSIIGHWMLRGFGTFAIEDKATGLAIGGCGAWYPKGWPETEVGWTIWDPAFEGGGWAFEAARTAVDHVYAGLGWDTAVSYIDPDNDRSIALAERLGAWRDDTATKPDNDDPPALVYRHPVPEGAR